MEGKCKDKEIEELSNEIQGMYLDGFNHHDANRLAKSLIELGYSLHPASELVPLDEVELLKLLKEHNSEYGHYNFLLARTICVKFGQPKQNVISVEYIKMILELNIPVFSQVKTMDLVCASQAIHNLLVKGDVK